MLNLTNSYIRTGGYPEVATTSIPGAAYFEGLFDSILFRDVVKRFKIRQIVPLQNLAYYLLANFSAPFTYRSIARNLGFASISTLENYISYLEMDA